MKVNKIILFLFVLCISIFIFSNSSYAAEVTFPEDYPSLLLPDDVDYGERQGYIIYIDNELSRRPTKLAYFYNLSNDIDYKVYKENYGTYFGYQEYSCSLIVFELENGIWVQKLQGNYTPSMYLRINGSEYLYSTFDIYDHNNGDVLFFPKTPLMEKSLAEEILEVTQEEMPKLEEKTLQQMMTILLCGVGCLALLVGLPILLKVFWKFL